MVSNQQDTLTGMGSRIIAERMGEAAANILASLAPDQRAKAVFDFDNQAERTFWHYTPIERNGLPLTEMDRRQQRLAHQLVATGLSRAGYVAASTIMGLETALDALEHWGREAPGRDPGLYFLSIFGQPRAKEPWGWQFEGHHLSLNYTIVNGQIVAPTPTFFGSNPAEAPLGHVGTLRPLAGEEDLARELVHDLDEAQRATAVIAAVAPSDIIMTNRPQVIEDVLPVSAPETMGLEIAEALRYTAAPKGLAAKGMKTGQRELLTALIQQYINRMPDEIAEIETKKLAQQRLDAVHFAWAGGLERREPHYYRLQGPELLIEYDNTQNDANHIHSVWRDPADDFGARLLTQHYAQAHKH